MYKRLLLVFAGLSLLAGCGGDGGGSSTSGGAVYSGVTTQATVTTSNAKALSVDAYSGGQVSAAVSGVSKETTDSSGQTVLLQQASGILEGSVRTIFGFSRTSAKVAAATVTAQNTVNGFSGSFSYSITYDDASGAFSGTITFSQYRETATSPIITGSLAFSGSYNPASGEFTSLNISLNNITGTKDGRSYGLAGSMSSRINGVSRSVSMSVVLTDNATARTYWVRDYALVITGTTLTLNGTYYDPIHGYVIISTVTPLTVSSADATPTAGQLLFTGLNGTRARLTFTASGYIVEVDTAGNGTYVVVP